MAPHGSDSPHSRLPTHLSGTRATGLHPGQAVAQYELGNLSNFVYLLLDWKSRTAAWVDPQKDLAPPLTDLKAHGFQVTRILLTHSHHDHVAGLRELAALFPEASVHLHGKDLHRIRKWNLPRVELLDDGAVLDVGTSLRLKAHHCPGHSAGALSYELSSDGVRYLLTGDTLFIRDCGRTDLETGSTEEMFLTLRKLAGFPPESVILPGHHYAPECASWLERELQESPPLKVTSVAELAALP